MKSKKRIFNNLLIKFRTSKYNLKTQRLQLNKTIEPSQKSLEKQLVRLEEQLYSLLAFSKKARAIAVLIIILAITTTDVSNAQIQGSEAFLKGNFVEVGMAECGSFGTDGDAPSGYHPRGVGSRLGFVADPDMDGWNVGSPNYVGGYFLPGTPEEGWGLTIDGTDYNNNRVCLDNDIAGSISGYTINSTEVFANWQGNVSGLSISKKTYIPLNSVYFVTEVTITNITTASINNVYYMRNVDPDHGVPTPGAGGNYETQNNIVFQNPEPCNRSLVSATSLAGDHFLGLGSIDSRARVTHGGFSNRSAQDIWDGTGFNTSGSNTADQAISISFNLGNLSSNESATFAYAYILSEAQLNDALAATNINFEINGTTYTTGNQADICSGTEIPINLLNTGTFTSWTWSPSTGLSSTTGTSITTNVSSPITYTATGSGACGTTELTIDINPIILPTPGNAGVITGPSVINPGQTGVSFSIDPVQDASSYIWNLPPGSTVTSGANSNSITINVSNVPWCGDISVTPSNVCGVGDSSLLSACIIGITTGTVPNLICSGTSFNVDFIVNSPFDVGNVFTAQLSDASGSFAAPLNIGTVNSSISNSISAEIPYSVPSGSGYRIRVVSSSPSLIGSDNGSDIEICFGESGSLSFDGINDRVDLDTLLPSNGDSWGLEFWVNPETVNMAGSDQVLFSQYRSFSIFGSTTIFGGSFEVLEENGFYSAIVYRFLEPDMIFNLGTAVANEWTHLALSYDENTNQISTFRNGVLQDIDTAINIYGTGSRLGFQNFNGKIDELRVWNKTLCEIEIDLRKNCELIGTEADLKAYYNFNNSNAQAYGNNLTETTLVDQSGNGFNGDLINFLLTGTSSNWTEPATTVSDTSCSSITCEFYWTGATSSDWNTDSNWSNGVVPTAADEVIIPDVSLASGNFPGIGSNLVELGKTTIEPNATLFMLGTGGIVLNDTLINNGTVYMRNSFLDDYTNPSAHFIGDIFVEAVPDIIGVSSAQRMFGSPVNNGIVGDLDQTYASNQVGQVEMTDCASAQVTPTSPYNNLFEWHEDAVSVNNCSYEAWWAINDNTPLENGRGYSGWMSTISTIEFLGQPNTGDIIYGGSLTNSNTGLVNKDGWHVLSNPYPSGININSITDQGWTSLQLYSIASGAYGGTFQPITPNQVLGVAQGFVAKITSGNSITYRDTMRRNSSPQFKDNTNWYTTKLEIEVENNGLKDISYIYFNNEATPDFDSQWDCEKRSSDAGVPTLYTKIGDTKSSLNGNHVSELGNESIPLGLNPQADATFTFTVTGIETLPATSMAYLEDKATGTWINLREIDSYIFDMTTTENEERFEVHFTKPIALAALAESCAQDDGTVAIDFGNQSIQGNSVVWEYAITLDNETVASGAASNIVAVTELAAGEYEVILTNGNYETTETVLVEDKEPVEANFETAAAITEGDEVIFNNLSIGATDFVWTINGEIQNTSDASYIFELAGTYTITLEASNEDCDASYSKTIEVAEKAITISSIDNLDNLNNILVYTDNNTIVVDLSNADLQGKTEVEVYDLVGQLIAAKVTQQEMLSIELSNKAAGFYLVHIVNNGKQTTEKVFLK